MKQCCTVINSYNVMIFNLWFTSKLLEIRILTVNFTSDGCLFYTFMVYRALIERRYMVLKHGKFVCMCQC